MTKKKNNKTQKPQKPSRPLKKPIPEVQKLIDKHEKLMNYLLDENEELMDRMAPSDGKIEDDGSMYIDFKQVIPCGTRWSDVLLNFLSTLSDVYGYRIDEYSLLGIVWQARQAAIGRLVEAHPDSEIFQREYRYMASMSLSWQAKGNEMRADYAKALEALKPKQEKEDSNGQEN